MRSWLKGIGKLRRSVEENRVLRPVAHWLKAPSIWHVSRRSVARGVALGLLCGFILPVGQIFLAAIVAVFTRSNLIVASLATLVTNPLTMPPIYFLAYKTGAAVLRPVREIHEAVTDEPVSASLAATLSDASLYMVTGLMIFAVGAAVLGYLTVHALWWATTAIKMRRRLRRQRKAVAG